MGWDKGLPGWHLREYVVSGRGAHPPCPALRGRAPHPPASRPPRPASHLGPVPAGVGVPPPRGPPGNTHGGGRDPRGVRGRAARGRTARQPAACPAVPWCPSHCSGQRRPPGTVVSFKAVTAGRSPGSGPFSARTRLCRGHSPCPSRHPLLPAFSAGPPSSALTGQKALRRLSPVVSLLRSVPSVSLSPQECDAEFLHARPVLVLGRQPGGLALCALLLEHAPTPRRSPVL